MGCEGLAGEIVILMLIDVTLLRLRLNVKLLCRKVLRISSY